jgi:hypothetical protein
VFAYWRSQPSSRRLSEEHRPPAEIGGAANVEMFLRSPRRWPCGPVTDGMKIYQKRLSQKASPQSSTAPLSCHAGSPARPALFRNLSRMLAGLMHFEPAASWPKGSFLRSRPETAGIDGSIGIRKLFLRAEVDRRQFDVEALLGDQDSHAAGIGRAAGMIEFQGSSPVRFRVKDPRQHLVGWLPGLRLGWPARKAASRPTVPRWRPHGRDRKRRGP